MLDLSLIPPHKIRYIATFLNIPEKDVAQLSTRDALDAYLRYEGIIGYTNTILITIEELRRANKMANAPMHRQDSDCTVDPNTGSCIVCHVDHSSMCPECKGRGFHKPNCSSYVMED
jgi:hypothetical protein